MDTNLGAALIAALAESLGELGLDMSRVTLGQDDAGAYVSDGTTVTRCTSIEEMRTAALIMAGGARPALRATLPGDWTVRGRVIVARTEHAYYGGMPTRREILRDVALMLRAGQTVESARMVPNKYHPGRSDLVIVAVHCGDDYRTRRERSLTVVNAAPGAS
jgi:hypothetical protein